MLSSNNAETPHNIQSVVFSCTCIVPNVIGPMSLPRLAGNRGTFIIRPAGCASQCSSRLGRADTGSSPYDTRSDFDCVSESHNGRTDGRPDKATCQNTVAQRRPARGRPSSACGRAKHRLGLGYDDRRQTVAGESRLRRIRQPDDRSVTKSMVNGLQ